MPTSCIRSMVVAMNQEQQPPSSYEWQEWQYDFPRRSDWRQGMPDFHPEFVGLPANWFVDEALDPTVLANRMKLFAVEHEKVFDVALKEVQDGYKNRDWIWSVFPQASGLPEHFGNSSSPTSVKFSIWCFDEAVAFLEHPILGSHYVEIVEAVRAQLDDQRGLKEIFDRPGRRDSKKVVSSVTLFRRAARVSAIGSAREDSADDEEQRTATRPRTEAERRYFDELVDNASKQIEEQQRPKNIHELLEKYGTRKDLLAVPSRKFVSRLGEVLIDHCDAILARVGEEDLNHCSHSQEFDSGLERQFAWRLDGGSDVPSFIPYDDESDVAFDARPWRGDAWQSRLDLKGR